MKKLLIATLITLLTANISFASPNASPELALRCHQAAMKLNDAYQNQESTICKYLVTGNLFEAAGFAIAHHKDSVASMSLSLEINVLNYAKSMECNDSEVISDALIEAASIQKELTA